MRLRFTITFDDMAAGQVVDLPDVIARVLIEAGVAEPVAGPKAKVPPREPVAPAARPAYVGPDETGPAR